jgi:phage shock protein PspC (stress-responsive transcriptional regulator)
MQDRQNAKMLTRGETGVIAGVCSGIADYYGLRKNGLRLVFLITSFFLGIPILAYIILWLVLPNYPISQAMARQLRRKVEQRRGIGS